jgi:non-heme chloroperoxidase
MGFISTKDGTQIFYKDWGPKDAQPIVFHHGWPLSSDDWDAQLMFFLNKGYRVIAHDRRGHGRSGPDRWRQRNGYLRIRRRRPGQPRSTSKCSPCRPLDGGGEVTRYVARHGKGRVAKAVLLDAVPPVMVKKDSNPRGTPIEVFDGYREAIAANRRSSTSTYPTGPF